MISSRKPSKPRLTVASCKDIFIARSLTHKPQWHHYRYYSQTLLSLVTPWTSAPPQITHPKSASLHSQPRPRRRSLHRQHQSPPPSHHSNKPSATRLNPSTTSLLMAVSAILVGRGVGGAARLKKVRIRKSAVLWWCWRRWTWGRCRGGTKYRITTVLNNYIHPLLSSSPSCRRDYLPATPS